MKVSIITPLNNEEGNAPILLENLIGKIKAWQDDYEIIAVDDNSTDNTPKILKDYSNGNNNILVVTKRDNLRGMGRSLIEGMKKAKGEAIVWVMADLSDDLNLIPALVRKIKDGYDIVFGSRYMRGGSRGELNIVKAFLSSRFTVFTRLVFGVRVHDITNAFRGFRRELYDKIRLESFDFAISPELAIKAHLLGYRMAEIPCSYKARIAGSTKFKIIKMMLRYASLYKYRYYKKKNLTK